MYMNMEFIDLVKFKTAQIMFKAKNNLLPGNLQKMFMERQGGYNLREQINFPKLKTRTIFKSMCITIG